ncbi:MAG: cytochrome c peroxidase [Bacteroidota bacterium]
MSQSLKYMLLLGALTMGLYACQSDDNTFDDPIIETPDNDPVEDNPVDDPDDSDPVDNSDLLIRNLNLPGQLLNYENLPLPAHFNLPQANNEDNTPNNNPTTNEGATLGRALFYDVNLSANNQVSCASCHQASAGFSDPLAFSVGFEGGRTGRNSMGLTNAKYYTRGNFFWDERAETLEDQVLMPIQDHIEMGLTLNELVDKVDRLPYYPDLFDDAFGSPTVSSTRISMALAQFVRSMVSYESRFDQGIAALGPGDDFEDDPFSNFTASENQGKALFFSGRTQCGNCHQGINLVGPNPRNNGLDVVYEDNGVGELTGNPNDFGDFKVGSLRNIALTGPYMHDGRFETLEEVIDHYDRGVQNHPNLSNQLRVNGNQVRRLNLNPQERQALIDFLHTLTDQEFINDEKWSDPFNG